MSPEWENELQSQEKGAWITIGSYDGVHLGHQSIIEQLVEGSHKEKKKAIVINFFPHPAKVLKKIPGPYYLTSQEEKQQILTSLGVDKMLTFQFDQNFAQQEADLFIRSLYAQLQFSCLLIGYDFKFGANRSGDFHTLTKLGEELGYCVKAVDPFEKKSQAISSSAIRTLISEGSMRAATELLGRPYSASGRIIHGDGRGRHIGLPTANIDIWEEKLLPATGVYAAAAEVNHKRYMSVINIGSRPTFYEKPSQQTVEVHLLDFSGEIYGQEMGIGFIERIRTEKKFGNADELMVQIKQDIQYAREVLSNEPRETNLPA